MADQPAGRGEAGGGELDRARQALAAARAAARARGARPAAAGPGPAGGDGRPGDGQAGARPRRARLTAAPGFAAQPQRDDPAPLSAAIGGLVADERWGLAVATGSVFGRWAEIVGPELAAHTAPQALRDGELRVSADSTAWATQVRLLAADLVRRLNRELGSGTVIRVRVSGPPAPAGPPGRWRVRGGRGPRDTYG